MRNNTLAAFRENLSQIALDVQDATGELEIYASPDSGRRISHRFSHSSSPRLTPVPNGIDSSSNSQIEQYKAEIQRLQASEAEIKALSINYAAILKEKEEELSRLHTEHSSLRQTLEATSSGRSTSRNQNLKTLPNNSTLLRVTGEQSITKQQRHAGQVNASTARNIEHKGINPKHDASSNGAMQVPSLRRDDKGLEDLLDDHSRSFTTMQATHKSEIKQLTEQLEKERKTLATIELKLQGERNVNEICQKELHILKMDKDKISMEMKETHTELNAKISEIKRLQSELNRKGLEKPTASDESLNNLITTLEKENTNLKAEKGELAAALKLSEHRRLNEASPANVDALSKHTSEDFLKLDEALKEACTKRDKALQELSRLKQHLLEKELEESEKMDEDSKTIEDLRATCEYQRAQISHLEKALKQAISYREEAKKIKNDELQKAYEVIDDLKNQLGSCMRTVDSKNVELLNLQSALGQYYAETEAKDRLGRDLAAAREESARLSDSLQDAHQRLEESKSENAEILVKLSQAERMASEGKQRMQKLEDDNIKVRRALEQSMTRLNRMSLDSDYFVDRRIVIKLLVTYFQRNHSKEVLDLMVRMLGFTEEDKQRIGFAQQVAGKSVVRGVLGLPGRLVGGILGGSAPEVPSPSPSGNQSFADLWVDFLLKETEERERRETAEALAAASKTALGDSPTASISTRMQSVADEQLTSTSNSAATFQTANYSPNQMQSPRSVRGSNSQLEHLDTEFSSIPLTSSASPLLQNSSRFSRLHPR